MLGSYKILGLLLISLFLFSCKKDVEPIDVDPVVRVFISSEKSKIYQSVIMQINSMGVYCDNVSINKGVLASIKFTDVENTFLVKEDQFTEGNCNHLWLGFTRIIVVNMEGKTTWLEQPLDLSHDLDFEFLDNHTYRIEITIDFDKSIFISEGNKSFYPKSEIKIEEL